MVNAILGVGLCLFLLQVYDFLFFEKTFFFSICFMMEIAFKVNFYLFSKKCFLKYFNLYEVFSLIVLFCIHLYTFWSWSPWISSRFYRDPAGIFNVFALTPGNPRFLKFWQTPLEFKLLEPENFHWYPQQEG